MTKSQNQSVAILALALTFPLLASAQPVPGYPRTNQKATYDRAAFFAQSKLPPPVALPVPPRDAIALPDDWAGKNRPLTIEFSQRHPGKLLVRRVSNNDGKLYLEIYSPDGKISGNARVSMDGKTLGGGNGGTVTVNGSLWFSLKPRIGKLEINIPIADATLKLLVPAALVETRGRQIYLNGEPFLMKGATGTPESPAIADYIHGIGLNTLRGKDTQGISEKYGFMRLYSLNSINAPKELFPKPDATFWKEAQSYLDKIPADAVDAIASPHTLIVQLGNERTGGENPPGLKPVTTGQRHAAQMLVAARNILKPLAPMLPLGYSSEDGAFLTPDCLDVYMHNSYLDKDRYEYPMSLFIKWQGCLPPDGPQGQGRPFVNSEFGANRYLCQSYHGGPNNPVLEKIHAWNIPNRWTEFMQNGTVGGCIYNLNDNKDLHDQGCSRFGILTDDNKVKLACWEVAKIWRDFTLTHDPATDTLHLTYKRDYPARDIRLTITPVNGKPVQLPLADFPPRSTRAIPIPKSQVPSPESFRWRLDYTTHSGLPNAAAGAWPLSLEQQDFLALLRQRDTAPFLTELFDTEVLTTDGKPAPLTLFEMTDSQNVIPVILRKPNGVLYLVVISRESPNTKAGQIKQNITLDIAFKGRIEQVDDMTGQPLANAPAIDATPTPTGLHLRNIKASRIPGPIGKRSEKPFMMPVYRITP